MKKRICVLLVAVCLFCSACSASVLPEMPAEDARELLIKAVENLAVTDADQTKNGELPKDEVLYAMIEAGLARILDVAELKISEAQVSCKITYRTDELISLVLTVSPLKGGTKHLCPMTFNMKTGKERDISAFFTKDDTWRTRVPELAAKAAEKKGISLLCAIPAIEDEQLFYIDGGDLVLVYRPYEIAAYNAGYPCLRIPANDIGDSFSASNGVG
ncbi:MAG: DUF3298 domain-containing protein [Eubacteriales bacterium]|nr:DUF3298 domain-containing protein [Eubacteriales bacterium]